MKENNSVMHFLHTVLKSQKSQKAKLRNISFDHFFHSFPSFTFAKLQCSLCAKLQCVSFSLPWSEGL